MKKIFTITLPTIIILFFVLEIVFRTIIPASTHPYFRLFEIDDYVIGKYTVENGVSGIKTNGPFGKHKSTWHINNHGWNRAIDYSFDKDTNKLRIAIIGDSYVEALNVNPDKSFTAILSDFYKEDVEVYSFGIGGSPFSQYLNFSRYVLDNYDPDLIIVVLTNNDFDQSLIQFGDTRNLLLNVNSENEVSEIAPTYHEIEQSRLAITSKKSALVRYLYYNIQINRIFRSFRIKKEQDDVIEQEEQVVNVINPKEVHDPDGVLNHAIDYLLFELKDNCQDKRLIILSDAQRMDIYKDITPSNKLSAITDSVKVLTNKYDIEYIHLYDSFKKDYEVNKIKFNYHNDYHWNAYGHKVVGETIYDYLTKETNQN